MKSTRRRSVALRRAEPSKPGKKKRRGFHRDALIREKIERSDFADDRRLAALRSGNRNGGGGDVARITRGDFRLLSEELHKVGNVSVAAGFQRVFDALEDSAKFRRAFGVELLDVVRVLRDDVVRSRVTVEGDLVEAGAIVEIAEAHEADFLEGGKAAVNGDEITGGIGEIAMNLFDARRRGTFQESFQNRDARLGNAQTRRLEARARGVDGWLGLGYSRDGGQRVIGLG